MKVAVVILNWNGRKLLEAFLPSVVLYSQEATVYMADNASTDDSIAFVNEKFPTVKIIKNAENWGFAKGYNQALSHLKEDILILLNSDVEVTENWLNPLIQHFETHPDTAVLQPKILDYKRKTHFEYAGAAGGYIDKFGYPFCRGRIFNTIEEDCGQYDEASPIFWASGACLAVRREVYQRLEGLDEFYFAHQEEIDFCWRVHHLKKEIFYIPTSRVYHLGGATLETINPQKTFLNFRNSLFNLLKNVPGFKAYLIIFTRLLLDGLAGVKFLLEGKPKHTWAILRAHFSFYAHFKMFYAKRKKISYKENSAKLSSIVWVYYLKGVKYFRDLDL